MLDCLQDSDAALRDAARWIALRHPEWDAELSAYLYERMRTSELTDAERAALVELLAKLAKGPAVQKLLAESAAG